MGVIFLRFNQKKMEYDSKYLVLHSTVIEAVIYILKYSPFGSIFIGSEHFFYSVNYVC
jgi:hypothetical protein